VTEAVPADGAPTGVVVAISVGWGDCDPAGIAFYPTIFSWIDRGGRAVLRRLGVTRDQELSGAGPIYPILAAEARFLAPIRLDDVIEVQAVISDVGRTSFNLAYVLRRPSDGVRVATGSERRIKAIHGPDGTLVPTPLDPGERAGLEALRAPG
jgi:YbgC/YbaW family acyl-CoA thioester hydrolase